MSAYRNDAGKLLHTLGHSNRGTPVSESSVCSRDGEDVGVRGAKLAASGLGNRPAVVHQVRRRLTVERFVDDSGQFIDDSLLH